MGSFKNHKKRPERNTYCYTEMDYDFCEKVLKVDDIHCQEFDCRKTNRVVMVTKELLRTVTPTKPSTYNPGSHSLRL